MEKIKTLNPGEQKRFLDDVVDKINDIDTIISPLRKKVEAAHRKFEAKAEAKAKRAEIAEEKARKVAEAEALLAEVREEEIAEKEAKAKAKVKAEAKAKAIAEAQKLVG